MTQNSGTNVSIYRRAHRCLPLLFLVGASLTCALLLFGTSEPEFPREKLPAASLVVEPPASSRSDSEVRLTGTISTLPAATTDTPEAAANEAANQAEESIYWEFDVAEIAEPTDNSPAEEFDNEELAADNTDLSSEPIAILLAPQAVPSTEAEPQSSDVDQPDLPSAAELALEFPPAPAIDDEPLEVAAQDITPTAETPVAEILGRINDDLNDEEQRLVALIIRESKQGPSSRFTNSRVNQLAIAKISQANVLADRGATFAARQKLIEVLRMVSQSKDAAQGKPVYSMALRDGLRAIEEAEDFSPRGAQLEAELDIELVVDAHRTPVAQQLELEGELPCHMLDRYLRYGQIKLAMSVAGDPAGSMALYALGKVTSRLGKSEQHANPLAHQQAVAYQQAAVLSHGDNYYAKHELAVLLAESGHLSQSHTLLASLAMSHQNPTLYGNLARVQEQLGMREQAAATRQMATALSRQNPQLASRVSWVAPQQFRRSSAPARQAVPGNMVLKPTHDRRTAQGPVGRSAMRTSHSTHVQPRR